MSGCTYNVHFMTEKFTDSYYSDLQYRWRELAVCASGIVPTRIPLEPTPAEITLVGDELRILARKVDALIESYGEYLGANSVIDHELFRSVLLNALDGNALYEIEQAAQNLTADIRENAYYARYNAGTAE